MIEIGCCGVPVSRKRYFELLPVVEQFAPSGTSSVLTIYCILMKTMRESTSWR